MYLKDQVAIVTGATAGIGKAIAHLFAEQGAKVALLGTNIERGEAAAKEAGASAKFYQVDVANFSQVEEVLKQIVQDLGNVDILVNNAGVTRDGLMLKMTEEDWDTVMAVNAKSCFNTCKALLRGMLKARKGKIINVSSVVGLTGNAGQANYAASKGAVISFTKSLALEVSSRNIQVNCIAPGFIKTRMTDELTEDQQKVILSKIPMGRMGTPEEIAKVALFLASTLSDYMTGQVVTVDGGMVT